MKITMLGSLGNVNRLVIPQLIRDGHEVTVISTSPHRQAAIEALGAHAAIGTMTDAAFLTTAFRGADVVYLMLSGAVGDDPFAGAQAQATIWQTALTAANVHRVVDLSSIGAEAGPVAGSLHAYSFIERTLRRMPNVDLAIVRPTGFYANLFTHLTSLQHDQALYSNQAADLVQHWVAPADIAAVVLPLIEAVPTGVSVHYAYSDTFSGNQFLAALRQALQLPDLRWVQISDEQYAQALRDHGVPTKVTDALIQTSRYQRDPAAVYADLTAQNTPAGTVKLADFISTYVAAWHGQGDHHAHTIAD